MPTLSSPPDLHASTSSSTFAASPDKDQRPSYSRSSSFGSFMAIQGFDRYGDEFGESALTLLDVVETFFDSRLDLFNRRLKAQSARLKSRAVELLPRGLRTPAGGGILLLPDEDDDVEESGRARDRGKGSRGEKYRKDVEREVDRIKVKLAARVTHLSGTWRSAQVVRTRDKVSFLFGVLSLVFTCLVYGQAPEWLPFAYTAQAAFYLPTRIWQYKRKAWHYFLFDLCYFVNVLDLLWIWVFPDSTVLFVCCYLLTLGPLASAIITWRNSLVFHSLDKVTSLFIHMYPPLVLTVIRHVYPNAEARYPGLKQVGEYRWYTMIVMAAVPYCLWQGAYYKFISVNKKSKIESGQRQNSFHYMLNDRRGPVGKALQGIRPEHRELWFIFGQLIYSIIFMLPPATLLIHHPTMSSIFLVVIFSVSAWNGATFYVEVFGRKFERELEKLRKEMELASATGGPLPASTSNTTPGSASVPSLSTPGTPYIDVDMDASSPSSARGYHEPGGADGLANSPLVLPSAGQRSPIGGGGGAKDESEVPELVLDKAAAEVEQERKKTV